MPEEKLVQIAMGREEASLYLKNSKIINVFTGEIVTGKNVAIGEDRIAYVGSDESMVGSKTRVLDCDGMFLAPGYIDVHAHVDVFTNPIAFTRYVLPTGTTFVMSELANIYGTLGIPGLEYMFEATELLPIKFNFSLPSCNPPLPELEGGDSLPVGLLQKYIDNPRVLALGEVTSWPRVVNKDMDLIEKIKLFRSAGKHVEGHLTGCRENENNALIAAGITSCHESITALEAKEKLGLGLYVLLRHGSVRRDLGELSRLITGNPGLNTSRIILTLDLMFPEEIISFGYMNDLVRSAVSFGIDPVKAIQMVTLNPATYLGLDSIIGSIAPGRIADILLLEDIKQGMPRMVIANGKIVAENGELHKDVVLPHLGYQFLGSDKWPSGPFNAEDFQVKAPVDAVGSIEIPVMDLVNDLIVKRLNVSLPVRNGFIEPDPDNNILKISITRPGSGFTTCFIKGFGPGIGGLATTIASYNNRIIIIGKDSDDMVFALRRLMEIGGGLVLAENGKIISEVPLSIGGIQSTAEIDLLAKQFIAFKRCLKERGCPSKIPQFTLHFLNMTGLPFVRITPNGLLDIKTKQIIFP